ncbi:helix-turn-helix domain-containing protein [Vibrio cionasavignyae]|uniref:helix-turn-helix domain-containing protein n=1 Tax=Vibrio cionasavignyae TaxID=2910252 RepID=UPI003D12C29A
MITWKQPLEGYEWLIHQIWYLEVGDDETMASPPQLIPNPRAHLLFTPPNQTYHYDNGQQIMTGLGSHLLSASEHLLIMDDVAPLKRIGITFQPDALYLINQKSSELTNQCGWYDWLETNFNQQFQRLLLDCVSQQEIVGCIETQLKHLGICYQQDKAHSLVNRARSLITERLNKDDAIELDVERLAQGCHSTRRTLERHFRQVTGLSIKKYQLMLKLERMVIALYEEKGPVDWAEFSQRFGFSDQSHLIKQLKQQIKRTPSRYLHQRDLTIDIYGDFEP